MVAASLVTNPMYKELKKEKDQSWVLQFLMKLRSKFENARVNIINHGIKDLDSILFELARKFDQTCRLC